MENAKQILFNVIGGALVAVLSWSYFLIRRKVSRRNFQKIFGSNFNDDFSVVYGQMKLLPCYDEKGKLREWNYYKPGIDGKFRISTPLSIASIRSASYLFEAFGENANISPELVSDEDIKDKLNLSFCSFGGLNNFKTRDILSSEQNKYFEFYSKSGQGDIDAIRLKDKSNEFFTNENIDYGFIIKIIPKSFPCRVWIACAGLGEWGTSGAAWYLAKNWKKIKNMFDNKPFGIIIKVHMGQDESSEMVYPIK